MRLSIYLSMYTCLRNYLSIYIRVHTYIFVEKIHVIEYSDALIFYVPSSSLQS
jgi:hypothetical protein